MNYDKLWYSSLNKPKFQPPAKVFPIVWGILYILMVFAFFIIIFSPISYIKFAALLLFFIQLGINLTWSDVFFKKHRLRESFELTILLLVYVILTVLLFYQVSPIASFLMLPYVLWCTFAAFLMHGIYKLNS